MKRSLRNRAVTILTLLLASSAWGQVRVGDNLNLKMDGALSFGYSGSFGDTASAHGFNVGGNDSIQGFYFVPQFLNFNVNSFYGHSKFDSGSQSVGDSTGVNGSVNFFSGSKFPGSVYVSRAYNNTGEYAIPGSASLKTNANESGYGINWAALLDGLPPLYFGYSDSSSASSIYGSKLNTDMHNHGIFARTNYQWRGFHLDGSYQNQWTSSEYPLITESSTSFLDNSTHSDGYQASVSHSTIFNGAWYGNFNRTHYSSGAGSFHSEGTYDSVTSGVTMSPTHSLSVSTSGAYFSNLYGHLLNQLGDTSASFTNVASQSFYVRTDARYSLTRHLSLTGYASHSESMFSDGNLGTTLYGGGVTFGYNKSLFGNLQVTVLAVDTATQNGQNGPGMTLNASYAKRFGKWQESSNFSYAQTVNTLDSVYVTSNYAYGSSLARRLSRTKSLNLGFSGTHSGLSKTGDNANHTEGYSAGLTTMRFSLSGSYSQSVGTSVYTSIGLVAVDSGIAPLIRNVILFNGRGFGVGGGFTPFRKMTISASYSKSSSDSIGASAGPSSTTSNFLNAYLQWRLRRLNVNAGYTRLEQGVGTTVSRPFVLNSFQIGVSRWFNIF